METDLQARLREADRNSQQRVLGSRIFGEAADRLDALESDNCQKDARIQELEGALADMVDALESRLTIAEKATVTRLPYEHPLSAYDRARAALGRNAG